MHPLSSNLPIHASTKHYHSRRTHFSQAKAPKEEGDVDRGVCIWESPMGQIGRTSDLIEVHIIRYEKEKGDYPLATLELRVIPSLSVYSGPGKAY